MTIFLKLKLTSHKNQLSVTVSVNDGLFILLNNYFSSNRNNVPKAMMKRCCVCVYNFQK